jgi:hypothetical protein
LACLASSLSPGAFAIRNGPDTFSDAQSVKVVEYCLAKGTLELGEKKIEVTLKITYKFAKTSGVYKGSGNITPPTDSVRLNAWLTLNGSELGLKDDGLIDLRIGMSGIAPPPRQEVTPIV